VKAEFMQVLLTWYGAAQFTARRQFSGANQRPQKCKKQKSEEAPELRGGWLHTPPQAGLYGRWS
jgi:hypothetical protein